MDEFNDQKSLIDNLHSANAKKPMEKEVFLKKLSRYKERFSAIKAEIEKLRVEKEQAFGEAVVIKQALKDLKESKEINEFSDILFKTFVEKIIAEEDKTLTFVFATGQTVTL